MKTKLTLTVEKSLISRAKTLADARSTSISSLVENYLSNLIIQEHQSFSQKWKGSFRQTQHAALTRTAAPNGVRRLLSR